MEQQVLKLMSKVRGSRWRKSQGSHTSTTDSPGMASDLPNMGRGQHWKGSEGSHSSVTASLGLAMDWRGSQGGHFSAPGSLGMASDLPDDLWMCVLAKLSAAEDLNACALVCRSWRAVVRSRAVGVEAPARDFFEGTCHGFQAVSQLPGLASLKVTAAETVSQPQGLEVVLKGMEKIGNLGPSLKFLLLGGGGRGLGWNLGGGADRDMYRDRASEGERGRDRDRDREREKDRNRDLTQDPAVHPLPASCGVHPLPASFSQLASLEKLVLEELPFLGSLDPVARMPRLRSLMVLRCPNAELPKDLSLMTGLETLTLKGCSHVPESIRCLTGLKTLTICGSDGVASVPDLSPLVNLQCLNLSHCSALERLPQGLERLPKLECLNIFGSRKLAASDVDDLRHACPRLQVLRAWPVTYHIIAIVQRAR